MRLITLCVLATASIDVSLAKKIRAAPAAAKEPALTEQIQALLDVNSDRNDDSLQKLQDFMLEAVKVIPGENDGHDTHTSSSSPADKDGDSSDDDDSDDEDDTTVKKTGNVTFKLENPTTTATRSTRATEVDESNIHGVEEEEKRARYEELSKSLSDDIDLEDVFLDALAKHAAMQKADEEEEKSHSGLMDRLFAGESLSSCIKKEKFHKKTDLVLFTQATDDMKGTGKELAVCVTAPIKALGRKGRLGLVGYRGTELSEHSPQKHDITMSANLKDEDNLLKFKHKAESYFKGKEVRQTPEGILESLKVVVNKELWSDKNNHFVMYPASNLNLKKITYKDSVAECLATKENHDTSKCAAVKQLGSDIKRRKIYFVIMKVNPVAGEDFLETFVEVAGISSNVVWMEDKQHHGNIDKEYCSRIGKGQLMASLHEMDCKANM